MYVQYGWLFRWILAAIGIVFLWFFIGMVFGATPLEESETTKQLIGCAAAGFFMGALLPWPPGP